MYIGLPKFVKPTMYEASFIISRTHSLYLGKGKKKDLYGRDKYQGSCAEKY